MNKARFFIASSIAVLTLLPLASMADCPLGAKEDHLTISRVMRNFGRFTLKADSVALNGVNPYERPRITDAQIDEATEKLGLAIDCADAVLKNPTGDLLPSHLNFMKDEKAKQEVIDDFIYFMTDFRDGLTEYREMLKALRAQTAAVRKFEDLNGKRLELDQLVERAHKKVMD